MWTPLLYKKNSVFININVLIYLISRIITLIVLTSHKMVKIALKPLTEQEFVNILNNQFNALLNGGTLDDIDIFRISKRPLRGSGFLDIIQSIGKFVLPAVKKYLAPVFTEFSHDMIDDISQGKDLKASLKSRGKAGLKKVGSRILQGKGRKGLKRKRMKTRVKRLKRIHSKQTKKRPKRGGAGGGIRKKKKKQVRKYTKKYTVRKLRTKKKSKSHRYHDIFS